MNAGLDDGNRLSMAPMMQGRDPSPLSESAGLPGFPSLPPAPVQAEDGGIDLWEYLRIVRRRWLLILLGVVVVVGATAFVTLRMTKIYRATCTIRIETRAPQVLGKDVEDVVEMGTGSFWSNQEYYETQYRVIESRDVASRVVTEFNLHEDPDFIGVPEDQRGSFEPATVEEATLMLQGMMTVEPVKDSRLVEIHIDGPDPARAQLLANAVAKSYVDRNLEAMLKSTVEAVDWLSGQLDDASSKLVTSEQTLLEYKKEHGMLSVSLEDRQNILSAQMSETASKLTEARSKRIEIESRKAAVKNVARSGNPMEIPIDALNNSALIQGLKQTYAELSQAHGEMSERYGENHPTIIELQAKMDRIKTDISREVGNILSAVDAELAAARSTEAGLTRQLDEFKAQAQEVNEKEAAYKSLAREATNHAKVYELLMGRTTEADLSRLLRVNNVEILDSALLPRVPIKPRLSLNLALAFVFGLILGLGAAVIVEFMDRTIKTQEDIEALGLPFLGIVPGIASSTTGGDYYGVHGTGRKRGRIPRPRSATDPAGAIDYDRFVDRHPKSQVAESLRSIRTNLLFMSADRPVGRILITSPSPQEGKTTVASNLAIVMAQSGSRVLIVDTDMRRPRLHKAFGIERPSRGISTMILGESAAEDSIVPSGIANLDLLPCGPVPPNPAELLHTDAFQRVVAELSARYDRVIFDSPPVGVVTDAAILSRIVDGTLIIVKSLQTARDAARHAVGVLRDIDAPILGAVLNDLDLHNRRYGKTYYYYYKKYGYYYGESGQGRETPVPAASESGGA
ncbi:MAG TPA: polysaccharide biosynthesis tyrosine autokinase [Polyangia bacterium]|nr:polysaccharide biosynthesis tyrosine autokinase [Polyangia bacterium]